MLRLAAKLKTKTTLNNIILGYVIITSKNA